MFSRSTLNGIRINGIRFGASIVVHENSIIDSVKIEENTTAQKRQNLNSSDKVKLQQSTSISILLSFSVKDNIKLKQGATVVIRKNTIAISKIKLNQSVMIIRRISVNLNDKIIIKNNAFLMHRFLYYAPNGQRFIVPHEPRHFSLRDEWRRV